MKNMLSVIIAFLLLLNGIGAVYGGVHLIIHPDGSSLQIPLSVLAYSPFKNFLIPGILLLVLNGMTSLAIFVTLLFKWNYVSLFVMLQGLTLTEWIIVQVIMLRTIAALHLIFLSVGILLIALGWLRNTKQKS